MDTEFEMIAPFKPIGDRPATIEQFVVDVGWAMLKSQTYTKQQFQIMFAIDPNESRSNLDRSLIYKKIVSNILL